MLFASDTDLSVGCAIHGFLIQRQPTRGTGGGGMKWCILAAFIYHAIPRYSNEDKGEKDVDLDRFSRRSGGMDSVFCGQRLVF